MKPLLRALIVEDSEDDTRLLLRELERRDYEIVHERVETAEALSAALDRESWDILFCDYTLPRFSGEAALEIVKERDLELPFIFVSGTLGEDVAVRAMKAGAHDYVMKGNLTRLVPAMERELGEAHVRRQRRQAEKAMRISEYKYRHLFESLSDAAFLIDTETGQIIDINPQGEALLGRPRTEILGMRENQLYPPRRDQAQPPALLTGGAREQRLELNVLRKNGGIVPVHVSVSKIELHDRHVLLALFHDITERKRLEQAQAWLGAIVDGSQDAIIGTTPEGTITSWNQGARRIFGYTPDEILGKSVLLLIPSERLEEEGQIRARIQRGERVEHYETVRRHKDGRIIDVSLTVSPILDGSGRLIGTSKIARNVTKQKLLESQLRQSQKMEAIGQLAGGVAHDFNNMLSVIFGHCELLEKALRPKNALSGSVSEILRASERAAALTRQLLAFSRRQVLVPKVVDLNAIVTEAETLLRRLIGEDVRLGTVLRADLHPVRVDPGQIDQVILNLAVNARDAMPHGGAFTMETSEVEQESTDGEVLPGRYILLTISDTGTGMTPEVQSHIFEPFFTTKSKGKGTGLGLSVVDGIVKQSGGHIAVDSAPGRGTRFKIYLPAVDEPPAEPAQSAPSKSVGGSETILLAEDEQRVRATTAMVLETLGYRVLQAASGEEALRLAENCREKIHLLMTDVLMPGMNGRDLADALRARDPGLKVLFQSGYTDDIVLCHDILHAEQAFLQKPFRLDALAKKVREVLEQRP